jgi:fatty acid desaturase
MGTGTRRSDVIAAVLAFILVAVLIGTAVALGGVALPVLLVLAGLVVVGWFALAGVAKKTPSELAERTEDKELLGPGGPDDPRR